jgi:hypothetical protein
VTLILEYPITQAQRVSRWQHGDRVPFLTPEGLRQIFETVGLDIETGLPALGFEKPLPPTGEFDYSLEELMNPMGNNNLSAARLFEERKKYKDTPYFMGLPDPMDSWYDKLYFGRVDRIQNGIIVKRVGSNFKQIKTTTNTNVQALNFVVDAFEALKRYIHSFSYSGNIPTESMFYDLPVYRAFQDPGKAIGGLHAAYARSLTARIIGNNTINNRVVDFKSYVKEFLNFMDIGFVKIPITMTGCMVSNFSTPMMSGLSIELYQGDYGDDLPKFEKYILDPNFRFFVQAARKFGFYVDRNAPWRLIADPFSGPMLDRLATYNINKNNFFYHYYFRTSPIDYRTKFVTMILNEPDFAPLENIMYPYDLGSTLMKMYNDFVDQYPRIIIETTSSVRCPHGAYEEQATRSPVTLAAIWQLGDLYWIDLYFKIRMREANVFFTNYNKKFEIARQLYKFYGPQNPEYDSWIAILTELCNGGWQMGCDILQMTELLDEFRNAQGMERALRYINNEIKPYLYDLQVGATKDLTLVGGSVRIGSVKD